MLSWLHPHHGKLYLVYLRNHIFEICSNPFPVLDKNDKLVGIVTKGGIIEGTLKRLEDEIKEDEISQYRASHFLGYYRRL